MEELEKRVRELSKATWQKRLNIERQYLIGSGERGDKIRTYRERNNVVIDHRSNMKMRLTDFERGNF